MKTIVIWILKTVFLIVLYFGLFLVSSALLSFDAPPPSQDQMRAVLLGSILISATNGLIAVFLIRSSYRHGWRLAWVTGSALYTVATLLSAVEALYYAPALSGSYARVIALLPAILLPNLALFVVFMPIAVRVLGRWRPAADVASAAPSPTFPRRQWFFKLATVAVVYYLLYVTFGFLVAWSNPDLQAMYASGANNLLLMVWGVIPLQLCRALLWVALALPVIRMTRLSPWGLALLVGLLFSLPMSVPLVMPNELLPDPGARLSHFYEITASNFIFGAIFVWLFHRSHRSFRDLLGIQSTAEWSTSLPTEVRRG